MNIPGFSARGSRVRGALRTLEILEGEGYQLWPEGGSVIIEPCDDLQEDDLRLLRDLKPELLLLASFTRQQRAGILHVYPEADLEDLRACRAALDAWELFTAQEKLLLDPAKISVRDVVDLGRLRDRVGGTITTLRQERG